MPSEGLLQTIPQTFRDPLENMKAAAAYAEATYGPRRAGKARKILEEIASVTATPDHPAYAEGGFVHYSGPADRIPVTLSPGEYILTPEETRRIGAIDARVHAAEWDVQVEATADEIAVSAITPPNPDDLLETLLPEPPTPPPFDD